MTHFGTTKSGLDVQQITISAGDIRATILTYGAIVQWVKLAGDTDSIALGSDHLSDYEGDMRYFGAIVGPLPTGSAMHACGWTG